MHAASADWTEFAPPQPPAQLRALALAVLAHVLLLGALGWGVSWRQHPAARRRDNLVPVERKHRRPRVGAGMNQGCRVRNARLWIPC